MSDRTGACSRVTTETPKRQSAPEWNRPRGAVRRSGCISCITVRRHGALGFVASSSSATRIAAQTIDFGKLAAEFRAAVHPQMLARLASSLGLSIGSLERLHVGWATRHRAWSFAMTDVDGNVLGIRLRRPDGRKLSVKGGKEGLFIPEALDGGRLTVCEGPTDTAAMLDLGFPAVGRPWCAGGMRLLVELVQRLAVPEVVIVADADPPGQRGAGNLASVLLAYCPAVLVTTPPAGFKDIRVWRRPAQRRRKCNR